MLSIGDELLVYGPAFFEKATIVKKEKEVFILNNNMKVSPTMQVLNSSFKVKLYIHEEFEVMVARKDILRSLREIDKFISSPTGNTISDSSMIKAYHRLTKIKKSFGL